jgi:hypothetical protein
MVRATRCSHQELVKLPGSFAQINLIASMTGGTFYNMVVFLEENDAKETHASTRFKLKA